MGRRAACQCPAGALLEPQTLACEFDMSESERRRRAARALGLGRGWREELVSVYTALASAMFVCADGWLLSATFVQASNETVANVVGRYVGLELEKWERLMFRDDVE